MRLLIIIFFLILSSCSLNKVQKHHGVHFLEKKNNQLIVKETNKNDVIEILGIPSTTSKFDNDVWIYIEREISRGKLLDFGKNVLVKNDILILEIDNRGILVSKKFSNIKDMQNIEFSDKVTESNRRKHDFIYSFLSSLRQKVNDPLG
jgi:Small protein A (tmRNA-binding)